MEGVAYAENEIPRLVGQGCAESVVDGEVFLSRGWDVGCSCSVVFVGVFSGGGHCKITVILRMGDVCILTWIWEWAFFCLFRWEYTLVERGS